MKLGFEDTQSPYSSGSQNARAWTEQWVRNWVYCPNCGSPKINPFPNNSPVADFFCEIAAIWNSSLADTTVCDLKANARCEELAMAWYRNFYECARCGLKWQDEWSCMCDDDCPHCDARHMSPYDSRDLTEVIAKDAGDFVVLWSPETAEHDASYRELGRFPTRAAAEAFLTTG
jgi:Dam-replacing family